MLSSVVGVRSDPGLLLLLGLLGADHPTDPDDGGGQDHRQHDRQGGVGPVQVLADGVNVLAVGGAGVDGAGGQRVQHRGGQRERVARGAGDGLTVGGVHARRGVVVQQVEGDVIQPLVLGRAVNLHPLVILLSITAGAVVAGIAGAFLAVPVAAVTSTCVAYFRGRGDARKTESGEGTVG
ncbi:MAG: AI-2E family transporter [Actinobacteria bacterium]|nr:AI-2E family transporter [Actinomycetota bacterium]